MRIFIIAGEASGDLHGSNLIKQILEEEPNSEIRFWGGDKMAEALGKPPLKHISELAFMGFAEVIVNLGTILGNLKKCKASILGFNPDKIVFIDYPGFNLKINKWANSKGFECHYYISPQIWAWKTGRVHRIAKDNKRVYTILPFEKPFFREYGYEVDYVGHPLLEAIESHEPKPVKKNKPVLLLLPGSRKQEISVMLPLMLEATKKLKEYEVIIAGTTSVSKNLYQELTRNFEARLLINRTYDLLSVADFAIVTSGTATLEAALFGVPMVVCYKGNSLSVLIARFLIKVKYISLVNLILDKPVVTELIQGDCTPENIRETLREKTTVKSLESFTTTVSNLKEILRQGKETASERVAKAIIQKQR